MRLLLDTNIFLRMMLDESLLSATSRAVLGDPQNERFVSAVCAWEIAIKSGIGKLTLVDPVDVFMDVGMQKAVASELPVRTRHAVRVASLPVHHSDPFDRLLIAQAQVEMMTIVTSDRKFSLYGVPLVV